MKKQVKWWHDLRKIMDLMGKLPLDDMLSHARRLEERAKLVGDYPTKKLWGNTACAIMALEPAVHFYGLNH